MTHWVGHSLMTPIDVGELFNIKLVISELESSLNDNDKIVASVVENQDEDRLGEQDNNNKNRTCIRKKGDI